jgi:hypothetical protein
MSSSTAQHSTAQHSTAQHSTAQHSTAQHSTAQHSAAQHSTAQHSTAQHTTCCWLSPSSHRTAICCCLVARSVAGQSLGVDSATTVWYPGIACSSAVLGASAGREDGSPGQLGFAAAVSVPPAAPSRASLGRSRCACPALGKEHQGYSWLFSLPHGASAFRRFFTSIPCCIVKTRALHSRQKQLVARVPTMVQLKLLSLSQCVLPLLHQHFRGIMNAPALHVFTVTANSVTAAVAQSNCHGGITVCAGLWYCPVVVCRMLAPAATSCHIPCRGSLFSSTLKAKVAPTGGCGCAQKLLTTTEFTLLGVSSELLLTPKSASLSRGMGHPGST